MPGSAREEQPEKWPAIVGGGPPALRRGRSPSRLRSHPASPEEDGGAVRQHGHGRRNPEKGRAQGRRGRTPRPGALHQPIGAEGAPGTTTGRGRPLPPPPSAPAPPGEPPRLRSPLARGRDFRAALPPRPPLCERQCGTPRTGGWAGVAAPGGCGAGGGERGRRKARVPEGTLGPSGEAGAACRHPTGPNALHSWGRPFDSAGCARSAQGDMGVLCSGRHPRGRAPPPRGSGRQRGPGARRAQAAEGTGAPDGPERRRAPRRPPGAEGPAPSMTSGLPGKDRAARRPGGDARGRREGATVRS